MSRNHTAAWTKAREARKARRAADPQVQARAKKHAQRSSKATAVNVVMADKGAKA